MTSDDRNRWSRDDGLVVMLRLPLPVLDWYSPDCTELYHKNYKSSTYVIQVETKQRFNIACSMKIDSNSDVTMSKWLFQLPCISQNQSYSFDYNKNLVGVQKGVAISAWCPEKWYLIYSALYSYLMPEFLVYAPDS